MDKGQDERNQEKPSSNTPDWEAFLGEEEEYEPSRLKSFIKKGAAVLVVFVLLINLFSIWPVVVNLPAIAFLKTSYELSENKTVQQVKRSVVSVKAGNQTGTGFNVASKGLIVTNYHVIEGTDSLYVHFQDGAFYEPVNIITYPEIDIAVLELNGSNLPHLEVNFEMQTRKKEPIYFVGNPLGFARVANEGTIEGTMHVDSISEPVLMIDAPVYQGNSGSPLVNQEGEVIGIVFATRAEKGENGNKIGLAVPTSTLKHRLENESE